MSGSMELFYIPNVTGDHVELENEQYTHAIRALRKKQGDTIQFTDGVGVIYEGEIIQIERSIASIRIQHRTEAVPNEYNVTVCVSLTKNNKRIEWALEKMTEMGIMRFTPIVCKRSERTTFNRERLTKILVSAMKQSQQAFLPILDEPIHLTEVLTSYEMADNTAANDTSANDTSEESTRDRTSNNRLYRYIAHKSDKSFSLKNNYRQGSDVVILIGPEGDFTAEELDLARKANFTLLGLGLTRLRTETAAVVAVAGIHAMNN